MAKTTNGNCTNCGRKGVLSVLHGGKVCNTCRYLLAAANNNVPALAGAVRTVGKVEEMIKELIPAGGSLAVQVTATLLQEISGIVGYDGEDPAELVEAVRKRVLTCASCDAEDVLHEIRDIVGYAPDQGDKGLADAVRAAAAVVPAVDCGKCTTLRVDLLRACGLEMDDTEDGEGWDMAVAAAVQTIGDLEDRNIFLGQRRENLLASLTIAQQARDEWEQRAVQAESSVELLESELKEAESRNGRLQYQLAGYAPEPSLGYCCTDSGLLDIALRALRGEGPDADQLAVLIDAARRAA